MLACFNVLFSVFGWSIRKIAFIIIVPIHTDHSTTNNFGYIGDIGDINNKTRYILPCKPYLQICELEMKLKILLTES